MSNVLSIRRCLRAHHVHPSPEVVRREDVRQVRVVPVSDEREASARGASAPAASVASMDIHLPEVVITVTASVDGRITLGRHQRLLDPGVWQRWASLSESGAFDGRHEELGATVVLEGSGSLVDVDAPAPAWPVPVVAEAELWRDHLPRTAEKWFVVADGRGRVDWTYTGDATTALHVLVCRATPPGYLQRLRDLGVGYFVVGGQHVDLRMALSRLREVFRADLVVADSGGTMNAALLREGLVDIIDVVTLPGLIGGVGTPSIMDGPELGPDAWPIPLELLESRVEGNTVRTRYRVLGRSEPGGLAPRPASTARNA
jgi:riboflavin biosynthesis pyrimidine reductase